MAIASQAGGSGTGYDDQEMLRMLRAQGGDATGGQRQMLADPTGGLDTHTDPSAPPPPTPAGSDPHHAVQPAAPTPMPALPSAYQPGPVATDPGVPTTPGTHQPGPTPTPMPTLPTAYQPGPVVSDPGAAPMTYQPGPMTHDAGMPTSDPTGANLVAPAPRGPTPLPGAPGTPVTYDGGTPNPGNPGDPVTYPTPPTPPTDPASGGDNWATKDYSDPNNIRSYFQSQGITDPAQLDRLVNTWSTYHSQPWAKDSAYFFQRMSQENDLGGKNGGGGGSGGSGGNGGAGGAPIQTNPYEQDPMVKEAIRKLLERGQTMPTGNDPTIRAQFNPQDQAIQQGAARAKAGAAERAFGQGQVGAGANDLASGQIDQASSQNEAGLMGNLIGNELQARRQDVVNALGMAQGEEKNALQQYLANLDAILRNQGLKNQNQQYYDDLGFRIGQSATGG